jgi:SUMO ligase MMS21 Smc5/6 complex component
LKTLNQLTETTNKILIINQEQNETNNTLIKKAMTQEATFDFLKKEAKDTKESIKIMNAMTELITLINANINNHINTYKQTIQEILSPLPEFEKKIDQNTKIIETQNSQLKNVSNQINNNH